MVELTAVLVVDILGSLVGLSALTVGFLSRKNLGGRCGEAFSFFMGGVISTIIALLTSLLVGIGTLPLQYANSYHLFMAIAMVLFLFGAYVVSTIQKV